MADELDLTKISLEDRITHKVWKARVNGYEELTKVFKRTDDEKSNEFSKYLGYMKKIVIDNNAVAQEKGLDAILAFLDGAAPAISGRVASDVVAGCITKCLNARTKTKEKGIEIIMMYVEVEKQDIVQEELLTGFSNKQPKIVAACTNLFTRIIREFGGKIFPLKPLVKVLPKLFDHSDKNVREEAKLLSIEIFKWIRDALKVQLQNIKPVQLKELEEEWSNLPPSPPAPTRLTRTEQKKLEEQQAQGIPVAAAEDEASDVADGGGAVEVIAIDPYEMMDPVDILSKIPKDFYENLEAKKWQLRKEALEALEKLVSNPKLEGGQYGELMSALKKVIAKDANVMVVALAAKCIAHLATGLRKKFSAYSSMISSAILEKFKEKKINVVTALRDAIDAIYLTTNLAAMQEDILASLDSKNPNVKEETTKFLTRAFCKSVPGAVPKAFLKPLSASLLKRMEDTVAPVRDAAAETLGTLLKLMGEKPMGQYIDQLDKIKAEKVREFSEKVEIKAASGGASSSKAASKPSAPAASQPSKPVGKKPPAKTGAAKSGGPSKGPPKKKAAGGKSGGGKKAAPAAAKVQEVKEPEMTDDDVDAKAAELLPGDLLEQLANANWKERFAGMERLQQLVEDMDPKTMECQVLIRVLGKKPGWKDSNFQVLRAKFQLCGVIAAKGKTFSSRSAAYAITGLVEKIGDIKLKDTAKETLMVISEKLTLNHVSLKVSKVAGGQKNPKVISESLNWLGSALKAFGFKIDLKPHIQYVKEALANTNPAVRTGAIALVGVLHMYVGANIRVFFEDEKPALLAQIDTEIERVKGEKPPAATRGLKSGGDDGGDQEGGGQDEEDGGGDEEAAAPNLADLIPRNDISGDITPELVNMLADKNWKIRGEGLQKVQEILAAAKFITPELGDLPPSLKARLGDSNKNLVTITLNLCATIATAMGPNVKRHLSTLGPAMFSTLADVKAHLRSAGILALNAWHKEIGMAPFIDGEVVFGALSTENPLLRQEVLGWLEEKLPNEKTLSSLAAILSPLYACLEDRNGDVRKKAQAAVPTVMAHLGYDAMMKQTNKLKPASKPTVVGILEKLRGTVPEPTKGSKSSSKSAAAKSPPESSTSSAAPAAAAGASKRPKSAVQTSKQPAKTSKKKGAAVDEDAGPPLLPNNEKDKRIKDEKDLKVMKWNFSTPRDEFIDQLKEQMSKCISKSVMTNLFHLKDFKFQIKALATLQQSVTPTSDGDEPPYQAEAIQSLDLLLKYVTLRFFDTNTTVLIKCLEFLVALFTMLVQADYQMVEHEASSFIPYLVQKVGDPKDVVRKMIRSLFKLITKVYPASKMFSYVMEGLTSKNAKTRTECLEELGCLIQVYGMNVCQPTPAKAISAISSQIGDRDNGVRNAALNTVVEAYFLVGDAVYKLAGRLNDKDLSYLEERIKRSSKNRPSTAPAAEEAKPVVKGRGGGGGGGAEHEKKAAKTQPATRPATAPASRRAEDVKKEFALDFDTIEGDGRTSEDVFVPNLVSHESMDDLISHPIQRPSTKTPSSPHLGVFSRTSAPAALNYVISQIASHDIMASTQALVQLELVIRTKCEGEILKHIDQFLNAAALQLNIILTTHIGNENESEESVTRLINCLTNAILTLFTNEPLATTVSRDTLKHLMQVLITSILDDRLAKLTDGPQIIRTINVLMAKIIQKSDPTVCVGALIRLLQDSVKMLQDQIGNSLSSPRFLELVMKALWKMIRSLPKICHNIKAEYVLLDIHKFLIAHPPQVWKARADDTPLRTIKSILHSMAKLKGIDILSCTNLIEDAGHSEVTAYLHKALKTGYKPTVNTTPSATHMNGTTDDNNVKKNNQCNTPDLLVGVETSRAPVAKLNDKLAEIFNKIASKENTREGLAQLYEFKLRYPQADIDPFLKKTSPFFQNYIDRGLRNIEMERKGKTIAGSTTSTSSVETIGEISQNTSDDASSYLDRLRVLRMKSGLGGNSNNTNQESSQEPVKPSPPSEVPTERNAPEGEINACVTIGPSDGGDTGEVDNIQDIKRRLEKIKNASRN